MTMIRDEARYWFNMHRSIVQGRQHYLMEFTSVIQVGYSPALIR